MGTGTQGGGDHRVPPAGGAAPSGGAPDLSRLARCRAVVLDVDGTLAASDHRVSERTSAALRRLQDSGVRPIVVTGRGEAEALRICRDAGVTAPAISCNGALITDPVSGERLRQVSVTPEMLHAAATFVDRHRVQLLPWTPDGVLADRESEATQLVAEINQESVVLSDLSGLSSDDVVKVMVAAPPEVTDEVAVAARIEAPFLERSMGWFLEATHPDATKWRSLQLVLARLGIEPAECAGIADGDNDREWLSNIGLPIAVANASPGVLRLAAATIGPNTEESVAALAEDWAEHLER